MALSSTNASVNVNFLASVGRIFAAIGTAIVNIGASHSKMQQVEALAALSDAELAERGMQRQDIVRVVFAGSWV